MTEQLDSVDFALAAFRVDGAWQVQELAATAYASVSTLVAALQRLPGDGGALGMVASEDDHFLLVRTVGDDARLLLSDTSAVESWDLAVGAVEFLGVHVDSDQDVPAGDLDLLHDLGMHTMDMAILLEDTDAYPDEQLAEVARLLGFEDEFDDALGTDTQ